MLDNILDRDDGIGALRHGAARRDRHRLARLERTRRRAPGRDPERRPAARRACRRRGRRSRPWPSCRTAAGRPTASAGSASTRPGGVLQRDPLGVQRPHALEHERAAPPPSTADPPPLDTKLPAWRPSPRSPSSRRPSTRSAASHSCSRSSRRRSTRSARALGGRLRRRRLDRRDLRRADPPARRRTRTSSVVRLRRNFGKSAALAAGFEQARGEIVVTIDADLQDDPAEIPRLLAKLEEGFDLVSGWKSHRARPVVAPPALARSSTAWPAPSRGCACTT